MASVAAVATPERWVVLDGTGVPIANPTRFLRYLDSVERSPNTVRGYAHDLAHFFSFLEAEDVRWKTLSSETLGKFVRSMRTPQPDPRDPGRSVRRSEATVNRALSAVASYARFQYESTGDDVYLRLLRPGRRPAWLSEDQPTDMLVAGPRLRTRQREPRVLSPVERTAIIGCCRSLRDEFLLTLLDQTGMRIGQALQLRHSDIKVPDSVVVVQKRADEGSGPRNKSWRTAVVPVDPTVIRLYGAYQHLEYGMLDSDYVFVNLWSGRRGAPMNYSTVSQLVGELRICTGIHDWSVHAFRHTFVTRLLAAGVPMETVSYLVTHASVTTTINTYGHMDVETVRAQLRAAGAWPDA